MAKISGKYEIVYIIDPAQGEEGIAALVEKFKARSGASAGWPTRSTTCPKATMS